MQNKCLKNEYVVAGPKGKSEVWNSEDFWKMAFNPKHPKNTPEIGYLVSQFDFQKDWESWEKHPNGDEIIFCISGKITFILENEGKEDKILLESRQFIVVPKNTWHTAKISIPSSALFITWGYGTELRSIDRKEGDKE